MSLSSLSVSRPITILMFYIGIVLLGIIAFQNLAVDFLPSIKIPKLTVQTLYPNNSPDEVENRITQPIEASLNTVSGVKRVSSISREGLSIVTVEFYWSTNMDFALLNVREKLDQLRASMPREANRSTILKIDPSTEPIMTIAVSSNFTQSPDIHKLMELKEFSQSLLKRRIEQTEGVSQVSVLGGVDREIQVELDLSKLQALGITSDQVSQALSDANINLPGGTIKRGLFRYSLRTVGEFTNIDQIRHVIIANTASGRSISILDIGNVIDTLKERTGLTTYNGSEIVSLEVRKEAGANTVVTSKIIHKVLEQLTREYPSLKLIVLSDQAEFINKSINDVIQAIVIGAILAFLVLFFFLRNPKYPVIIGMSIPISIIATFVAMYFLHITLNIISLTGLALGIGMLGDNAIIVIENVTRLREKGLGIVESALEGAKDINIAVTASTLTNVAIFLPIIFVEGVGQQLFIDMGVTMTVSLMVSLLVAVTLVPMMVSREKKTQNAIETGIWKQEAGENDDIKFAKKYGLFAKKIYKIVDRINEISREKLALYLEWGLKKRWIVIMGILFLFSISILIAFFVPSEPAPDIDNSRFVIQVKMPKGSSLKGTTDFVKMVEKELSFPGIEGIYSSIGITENINFWTVSTASMEEARMEVKVGSHETNTTDNENYEVGRTEEVISKAREVLRKIQSKVNGVEFSVKMRSTTFEQILRPEQNDIKIFVMGKEPTTSTIIANQFSQRIQHINGLTDLRTNLQAGNPEYKIVIDREKASQYKLSVQQVAQFISNIMQGKEVTFFSDFDRKIAIRVQPIKENRKDVETLLNAPIETVSGTIPLRELVRLEETTGYAEIWHENQQRAVMMTANVSGRSLGGVVGDIQKEINSFTLPAGYFVTIGGEREDIEQSFRGLLIIIVLSIFLVYMILAAEYESISYPFVILLTSPLAFIGAIFAMVIAGQHYNIMSLIGLVIMIGAVDNDAVIAVDIITALRREGKDLHDAITIGMTQRLRPILMTTATTVLGIIPLVFEFGTGSELVRALTIPLVGGMISSTLFTIIAIPIVYTYIDKWTNRIKTRN